MRLPLESTILSFGLADLISDRDIHGGLHTLPRPVLLNVRRSTSGSSGRLSDPTRSPGARRYLYFAAGSLAVVVGSRVMQSGPLHSVTYGESVGLLDSMALPYLATHY